MKTVSCLIILSLFACPFVALAEEFQGAPVLPGGKEISKTEGRLEKAYDMPYDEVLKYFQQALKGLEDVKFRDRKDETYIEDHSNRPWHSITVTKEDKRTLVVITTDNWTWILGTLVLRFIGVFVVLLVLYVAMEVVGAIVSRMFQPAEAKN